MKQICLVLLCLVSIVFIGCTEENNDSSSSDTTTTTAIPSSTTLAGTWAKECFDYNSSKATETLVFSGNTLARTFISYAAGSTDCTGNSATFTYDYSIEDGSDTTTSDTGETVRQITLTLTAKCHDCDFTLGKVFNDIYRVDGNMLYSSESTFAGGEGDGQPTTLNATPFIK